MPDSKQSHPALACSHEVQVTPRARYVDDSLAESAERRANSPIMDSTNTPQKSLIDNRLDLSNDCQLSIRARPAAGEIRSS